MTQSNELDLNETKPLQDTIEGHEDHEHDGANNSYIVELTQELEGLSDPEIKLQKAIDFMEKSLSQNGTPHFKSFWQARDICLQLFKENISSTSRTVHWNKYSELSKEARRLKVLLDEQSAFAVEQIEIAIQALETALSQPVVPSDTSSIECKALAKNMPYYLQVQNELNQLNTHATRINALRKELIKTEMRVRKKNKFFQRLSQAGDKVFPRRKELIKEISDHFIKDVDAFISAHFGENNLHEPSFMLRDEIKHLQGVAKSFTLNTHAFTHTRLKLSECWDKLKHIEKERKHEKAQQKAAFKHNVEAVVEKINAFNQTMQNNELGIAEANKQLDEISEFMRSVELGRDEVKFLREQLTNARQPVLELMKSQEEKRLDLEREKLRQKQQKIIDLKQEIENLIKSSESYNVEDLTAARESVMEKIQSSAASKLEKLELEKMLKPLRDIISDKKEKSLLSLSADDRNALQQLREVLKQKIERRQEIKEQLESLRRSAGASGLDFERAMEFTALINEEKERLEKINVGIIEIEQTVKALQKRV